MKELIVILDIINYLQGNINLNDFKGIAYKSEDQIVYTEKQDTIKDLDTLSFPVLSVKFTARSSHLPLMSAGVAKVLLPPAVLPDSLQSTSD